MLLTLSTREGLVYLGNADDSPLTDYYVHTFFCGDDPDNDSAGEFVTFSINPTYYC
jgi:hypothetical protein